MQLAMLQADPGFSRVAAGGNHHAVAAWTPLRFVSMIAMRLIVWNAQRLSIDLDLAERRGTLNHSCYCHASVAVVGPIRPFARSA